MNALLSLDLLQVSPSREFFSGHCRILLALGAELVLSLSFFLSFLLYICLFKGCVTSVWFRAIQKKIDIEIKIENEDFIYHTKVLWIYLSGKD